MGAGASAGIVAATKTASVEELQAALKDLPDDIRAKLSAALGPAEKAVPEAPSAWAPVAQQIAEQMQQDCQKEKKMCHLCLPVAAQDDAAFLDAVSVKAQEAGVKLAVMTQSTKVPKAVGPKEPAGDMAQMSYEQLYGYNDEATEEWVEGVFESFFRRIRGGWGVVFWSDPGEAEEANNRKWEFLFTLLEDGYFVNDSNARINARNCDSSPEQPSRVLFVARSMAAVSAAAISRFETDSLVKLE